MLEDILGIFKSPMAIKIIFLILEVTWHFNNKKVSSAVLSKSLNEINFKYMIQFI